MTLADHLDRLERGWRWLAAHPDHPEHRAREDRFIGWLRRYEAAVRKTWMEGL